MRHMNVSDCTESTTVLKVLEEKMDHIRRHRAFQQRNGTTEKNPKKMQVCIRKALRSETANYTYRRGPGKQKQTRKNVLPEQNKN